jgi:hypothetical protein
MGSCGDWGTRINHSSSRIGWPASGPDSQHPDGGFRASNRWVSPIPLSISSPEPSPTLRWRLERAFAEQGPSPGWWTGFLAGGSHRVLESGQGPKNKRTPSCKRKGFCFHGSVVDWRWRMVGDRRKNKTLGRAWLRNQETFANQRLRETTCPAQRQRPSPGLSPKGRGGRSAFTNQRPSRTKCFVWRLFTVN